MSTNTTDVPPTARKSPLSVPPAEELIDVSSLPEGGEIRDAKQRRLRLMQIQTIFVYFTLHLFGSLASSRLCFSALLMLSDGAMSPTMHSAMS